MEGNYPGDNYPGANYPGGKFVGGNCLGGNYVGGQLSGGGISWGAIVLELCYTLQTPKKVVKREIKPRSGHLPVQSQQ